MQREGCNMFMKHVHSAITRSHVTATFIRMPKVGGCRLWYQVVFRSRGRHSRQESCESSGTSMYGKKVYWRICIVLGSLEGREIITRTQVIIDNPSHAEGGDAEGGRSTSNI